MRRIISMAVLIALIVVPAHGAAAGGQPVRSGNIVTGYQSDHLLGEPGTCWTAPDCVAWLKAGCAPALAGRQPAVMASIVDVADLADGVTSWWFDNDYGYTEYPGWVGIQLWRRDCTEIKRSRGSGNQFLTIPARAKWMTVTAAPSLPRLDWPDWPIIKWTLTGERRY